MSARKRNTVSRFLLEVPLELVTLLAISAGSFIAIITIMYLVATTLKLIGLT